MFTAAGDGTGAGSAPVDPTTESIVIVVEHFSVDGVASVTPEQRRLFREKSAANAEQRLGRRVGANLQDERMRQLTGTGDEEDGTTPAEELEAIADEYEREVIARRRANAAESCTALKTYVHTVIGWERMRQIGGLSAVDEAASQERIAEANEYASGRYQECENEAIKKCRDAEDPAILLDFWLSMDRPADQRRAERLCLAEDYRIDRTVSRGELSVTFTIQYTSTKCGGLDGRWEIDSAGTLTGGGDSAQIGGPWIVDIPEGSTSGTFQGVANFRDDDEGGDSRTTRGSFSGTAEITEDPPTLVLTVTSGGGDGYSYGFTDTSLTQPGTLTLPLEAGSFCEEG
jgi:hypothetical protein